MPILGCAKRRREAADWQRPASTRGSSSLMAVQPEGGGGAFLLCGLLTDRQAAVADAISRGMPNKVIAYELNLCENTVKVHIRGIMKKLQARNREMPGR